MDPWVVEMSLGMVIIPWCIWVSVSIFDQKKGIALIRQNIELNKELFELLKDRLQ